MRASTGKAGTTFGCVAYATGGAVAVSISNCTYGTLSAPNVALPGLFASTANHHRTAVLGQQVCGTATANYPHGDRVMVQACWPTTQSTISRLVTPLLTSN
jgi:hypothetical protein